MSSPKKLAAYCQTEEGPGIHKPIRVHHQGSTQLIRTNQIRTFTCSHWNLGGSSASPSTETQSFPPLFRRSVASVTSSLSLLSPWLMLRIAHAAAAAPHRWRCLRACRMWRCTVAQPSRRIATSRPKLNTWLIFHQLRRLIWRFGLFRFAVSFSLLLWGNLVRFYCDKEAWEINKCPLDNKCYINKRALGSNGILKNVGELTYISSLILTLCTSGVSMQNFQDILNLAEFCRTFQNHKSVFLFIFFSLLDSIGLAVTI